MRTIRASKNTITLETLGRSRFYTGLLAGCTSAILLALFFNYGREIMRLQTMVHADLLMLSPAESRFYDAFFACFAAVLGHTILLWVWMQGHYSHRIQQRLKLKLAGSYLLTIFWVTILVVSRFGFLLPLVLFGIGSDDQDLNLYQSHPWLFMLLPVVIFLQGWMAVRMHFRLGWAMVAGAVGVLGMAAILFFTASIDHERLNRVYRQQFYVDFQTIDSELALAEKQYDIRFSAPTIAALEQNYSLNSMEQVAAVKTAFSSAGPVSLDTIILQKIILKNYKPSSRYRRAYHHEFRWHYVTPAALYQQLSMVEPQSNEAKELLLLFEAMINLVNVCIRSSLPDFDPTFQQGRRNLRAAIFIPLGLMKAMEEVRTQLLNDPNFGTNAERLPKIDFEAYEARELRMY